MSDKIADMFQREESIKRRFVARTCFETFLIVCDGRKNLRLKSVWDLSFTPSDSEDIIIKRNEGENVNLQFFLSLKWFALPSIPI